MANIVKGLVDKVPETVDKVLAGDGEQFAGKGRRRVGGTVTGSGGIHGQNDDQLKGI